jgi:hypothetical protein
MAKFADDSVMDAALAEIATSSRLGVCSAQPANFAGIAAVLLAEVALTPGDGNGDFVIADGDVSGRKVTVTQQADMDIDVSGDATHVTLDDATTLQLVTTCDTQALTDTGTVTVPAFDDEIADPT